MTHIYVGLENLALNAAQKQTLVNGLRNLGPANPPNPCHKNHWKVRLDNNAVIFEAEFNPVNWEPPDIKVRLASIFGIDPALISHTVTQTQYGPMVTFTYNSVNYIRVLAFNGLYSTWELSRLKALSYILANLGDWEL